MFPLRRFLRALSRRARALSGQGGVLALWRYYSPFRPLGVVETGAPAQADTLVIFLPGIEDSAEDFHAQGFPQALRARFPGARCVALDAHLGYYLTRRIVRCLHEEIVRPARAAGVRRVVLVGVSMGALGALSYLRAHPREVQGLVLMAPFLGRDWRIRRFAARPDRPRAEEGFEQSLWACLLAQVDAGLPVCLAYGGEDRMQAEQGLLAARLPEASVWRAQGGHAWTTWAGLWLQLLTDERGLAQALFSDEGWRGLS